MIKTIEIPCGIEEIRIVPGKSDEIGDKAYITIRTGHVDLTQKLKVDLTVILTQKQEVH